MNYIDLFAGAGGISEGFRRAGFIPIAHVEQDPAACFTLKTRLSYYYLKEHNRLDEYVKYLKGAITRDILYSLIPNGIAQSVINSVICDKNNRTIFRTIDQLKGTNEIDVIVGGPPCQAYSVIGRARDHNGMMGDPRNYLYMQYGRFLRKYWPKIFVFENVKGMLSAEGGKYFKNIQAYFKRIGYQVESFVVNAFEFGVLQNRQRVIIVGWKKGLNFSIQGLSRKNSLAFKVSSIFEDLPKLAAGEGNDKYAIYAKGSNDYLRFTRIRENVEILTQHIARSHTEQDREIYRLVVEKWNQDKARMDYNDLPAGLKTHRNRHSFLDRFKVVAADLPYSQTVVAHIAKDGHYYIHPDIEQNRSISVREAARLQSFPDDFYFEGIKEGVNRTAALSQIGNAVPPLMMEQIARRLLERLQVTA
jgi:DNA (cytosine-5)-methyltransferase 1